MKFIEPTLPMAADFTSLASLAKGLKAEKLLRGLSKKRYFFYYLFSFWTLLYSSSTFAEPSFGYVSCASYNIGDDVQSLAAKQFLPKDALSIDREFIGVFKHHNPVQTIVNGWFMHTKDFCWYRLDAPAPAKSWPPSYHIEPLLISIHLAEGFIPLAFSQKAISYLRANGPVGARDLNTLNELRKRNIPSYFSGCLTLTLKNECTERDEVIYAVDLDDECVEFIKSHSQCKVERTTHILDYQMTLDPKKRLKYVNELLEKYKRAKCVVTVRLHAAMPCLAFETPVLLINRRDDPRFHGLRELTHHCTREEFLNGQMDFNFDHPEENPKDYLVLRKNLIDVVTNWISWCYQNR